MRAVQLFSRTRPLAVRFSVDEVIDLSALATGFTHVKRTRHKLDVWLRNDDQELVDALLALGAQTDDLDEVELFVMALGARVRNCLRSDGPTYGGPA